MRIVGHTRYHLVACIWYTENEYLHKSDNGVSYYSARCRNGEKLKGSVREPTKFHNYETENHL